MLRGALAAAMAEGRTVASVPATDDPRAAPTATLVARPARALADLALEGIGTERELGADQSLPRSCWTSGCSSRPTDDSSRGSTRPRDDRVPQRGRRFPRRPAPLGFAEVVAQRGGPTTVAMLEEFIADGGTPSSRSRDARGLADVSREVSLEYATEIAADLGTLTAGLHAAVADGRGLPQMAPRDATRDEVRSWAAAAHQHLATALDLATGAAASLLRDLAPRIAESISVIDALPTAPEVVRAHGDYHLGQVLIAPDGFRIVDFEGEPLSPVEVGGRIAQRCVTSPRCSARSTTSRAALVDAEAANGGRLEHVGLDLDAWIARARERFLEAYRAGLLERRVWADIDPDLLHAFEVDKELYEFAYAATYLPAWLYAPTEGMRALFPDRGAA